MLPAGFSRTLPRPGCNRFAWERRCEPGTTAKAMRPVDAGRRREESILFDPECVAAGTRGIRRSPCFLSPDLEVQEPLLPGLVSIPAPQEACAPPAIEHFWGQITVTRPVHGTLIKDTASSTLRKQEKETAE